MGTFYSRATGFQLSIFFKKSLQNKFPNAFLLMRRKVVLGALFGVAHSILYHDLLNMLNLNQNQKVVVTNSIICLAASSMVTHSLYAHFYLQLVTVGLSYSMIYFHLSPDKTLFLQRLHVGTQFGDLSDEERDKRR